MKFQTFSIVAGTRVCNAKCPYCVSQQTSANGLTTRATEINWRNFKKACRMAQIANVTTAMFTGKGEPTLYPEQITGYLKTMEPYGFPLIELQTNGLTIGRGELEDSTLGLWHELGLTTVAISLVHYQRSVNQAIYTPASDYMDLPAVIAKLHELKLAVRLAVVMINGAMDNPVSIEEMIDFAKQHRVEQLTFRPVNKTEKPSDQNPKSLSVWKWTEENHVSKEKVGRVHDHFARRGRALMHLPHGATIFDVDGQNTCLTNSLTIDPNREEQRQLIFFPDGSLYYDWQFPGARIL